MPRRVRRADGSYEAIPVAYTQFSRVKHLSTWRLVGEADEVTVVAQRPVFACARGPDAHLQFGKKLIRNSDPQADHRQPDEYHEKLCRRLGYC